MRLELAKSNSKPKRIRSEGDSDRNNKSFRGPAMDPGFGMGYMNMPTGGPNYMDPQLASYSPFTVGSGAPQGYQMYGGQMSGGMSFAPHMGSMGGGGGIELRSGGGGTPRECKTLFVANLPQHFQQQELTEVAERLAGYSRIRFGKGSAWVDFIDTDCSSRALPSLQGLVLPSAVGQEATSGLRVEYAKSNMGVSR
eukprot:CAMPEP_0196581188 /NCGR_PEP_ID=MMETSP1081-20130531/32812_1 /TAXON_ID=36882 /ORGANISM="Pyramimonas amylifera, Strain CCMP720" /LENGTH=195 /DNA_ID=CAMNT_0041901313 /DNA_START=342 /DNA_END=929 /DNA_ORIENTATION=+